MLKSIDYNYHDSWSGSKGSRTAGSLRIRPSHVRPSPRPSPRKRGEGAFNQYGLVLPVAGFAGVPERISWIAAWAPIVMKRLSPPTVTKVKPISIIFLA